MEQNDVDVDTCVVCNEPLDDYHVASCQMCGGKFHQPWSSTADVSQCGRVTSHQEALAIVFLCQDCFDGLQDP